MNPIVQKVVFYGVGAFVVFLIGKAFYDMVKKKESKDGKKS